MSTSIEHVGGVSTTAPKAEGTPRSQFLASGLRDPDIAEVRAALSCWRQGVWSRAYALEQFERLLQGFVDRHANQSEPLP
jgi:hypothetical protein